MELSNTEDEYGLVAKSFHWLIAVMILALLPMGLFMGGMANTPLKFEVFAMHKSFGLLVFFLGLARIIWRFVSSPPDHMENHAHWEVVLASAAHFWLYVCIIGMPLSGWLMSSAGEFPIPFFGIQMPALIGKNEHLGDIFYQIHEILAYTLLFVLALHIAGALKHHVLDKDETLERMTWHRKGWLLPAMVVIVAGTSFAASALFLANKFLKPEQKIAAPAAPAPAMPAVAAVDTSALPPHGWAIVPAQTKLQFQATLYGKPFTGDFHDMSGSIVFDPNDLSTARADILIGMKNVTTGDADRDKNIVGSEWFDSDQFPDAHYVTTKFEKGDGNKYVAVGNVTIHGVTMPLLIPFTLEIKDKTAHMTGKFSLDRTHFAIGTGQWEDEGTVLHNVDVSVDLTAVQ